MPDLFIAADGGEFKPLGAISEDGITLSASSDEPWDSDLLHVSKIKEELTATISHVDRDALDCFFTLPEVGQKVGLMLEYVRKRRSDLLGERAEAVGGKFLRHYLRSQRISRANTGANTDANTGANTGAKPFANGGIMMTRVIFPEVTIRA